jgi:hypothetical protein
MTTEEPSPRERIRASLDAIPEGAIEDPGEILIEWPIAIYTISESTTTTLNLLRGIRCGSSRVLDVSGGGVTDASGEAVIRLKDVTCVFRPPQAGENYEVAGPPINVLATPRGRVATHLSVQASLQLQDRDAEIQVFAWDVQGQPVAGAAFYWRCTVALIENVG